VLHYGVGNFEYNADFDRQQVNAGKIIALLFWQQSGRGRVPYGVVLFLPANCSVKI